MLFFCPEQELELDYWSWKRSHPKASFAFLGYSWQRRCGIDWILLRIHFECQCCLTAVVVFVVVVLAGLRAYCYCSSWSSGLCECVHFLQLTTAAAAATVVVVVVVESKSTSTATTLVFGAGKERRELCFCRLLCFCSSALPLPAFASTTGSKLAQLPRPPKHPREQPSMVEPSKRLGTHQTTPRPSF